MGKLCITFEKGVLFAAELPEYRNSLPLDIVAEQQQLVKEEKLAKAALKAAKTARKAETTGVADESLQKQRSRKSPRPRRTTKSKSRRKS